MIYGPDENLLRTFSESTEIRLRGIRTEYSVQEENDLCAVHTVMKKAETLHSASTAECL